MQRVSAMLTYVVNEGRLCALKPSEWSILLGGVFFDPATTSSAVLDDIARVLPISHFIAGMRGAIQPDGGLSHHVGDLVVLALWGLFGLYFAIRGFSWDQRRA